MDGIRRRQTIAILVDNEAGVLSQVSRMFSRKGYNIESIASGVTSDPNITRITIELTADDGQAEFLCNQLRKIIQVHSVKLLTDSQALRRELVLFKVATKDSAERNEIIQVANNVRASVIDVAVESLTIAVIGDEEKAGYNKVCGTAFVDEDGCTIMNECENGLHSYVVKKYEDRYYEDMINEIIESR